MASEIHTASSGDLALERLAHEAYHVVILDVFMPGKDGLQTLQEIMQLYPATRVIMSSAMAKEAEDLTVRALEMGAVDFIVKPAEARPEANVEKIKQRLQELFLQLQVEVLGRNKGASRTTINPALNSTPLPIRRDSFFGADLVLIAASTGGPAALKTLFAGFKTPLPVPVLVVQHMPAGFTLSLAQNLDKNGVMPIAEGQEGELLQAGHVLIAPGGKHMLLEGDRTRGRRIHLEESAMVNGVRPAADVLFQSVAHGSPRIKVLAVVLTGMGSDGLQGVRSLKTRCDCYCLSQSEASSVVYGMPKSIKEAGLADEVLDIESIADRIEQLAQRRR
jgi:two-component system chemotaxis response regulator CheB